MMGNFFNKIILILVFFSIGCSTTYMTLKLKNVEVPNEVKDKYKQIDFKEGDIRIQLQEYDTDTKKKYNNSTAYYKDSLITITFGSYYQFFDTILPYAGKGQINFNLKNNTNKNIVINWDESSFVDTDGNAIRITHGYNIDYLNVLNIPQMPTIIPPNESIQDCILPITRIGYYSYEGKNYVFYPLYRIYMYSNYRVLSDKEVKNSTIGKTIKWVLPVKFDNNVVNYNFIFEIKDIQVGGDLTFNGPGVELKY